MLVFWVGYPQNCKLPFRGHRFLSALLPTLCFLVFGVSAGTTIPTANTYYFNFCFILLFLLLFFLSPSSSSTITQGTPSLTSGLQFASSSLSPSSIPLPHYRILHMYCFVLAFQSLYSQGCIHC
ncbi:hypothetical protein BDZ91DRAFT_310211 [Kalaharituber pfeilii]|nr:hypothetical protein BDZ91DRAFT_310211 [Kalaharituber pfeilii]